MKPELTLIEKFKMQEQEEIVVMCSSEIYTNRFIGRDAKKKNIKILKRTKKNTPTIIITLQPTLLMMRIDQVLESKKLEIDPLIWIMFPNKQSNIGEKTLDLEPFFKSYNGFIITEILDASQEFKAARLRRLLN